MSCKRVSVHRLCLPMLSNFLRRLCLVVTSVRAGKVCFDINIKLPNIKFTDGVSVWVRVTISLRVMVSVIMSPP